ncbi:uncharacterized protein LOC142164249 [Nicotiana tabacum]|uniref:Uncharacterized protein LOC142164249 n=1 Tax=Nicotiana tabacum TaxID=4097 RepID=A0AC58RYW6_TOBAC
MVNIQTIEFKLLECKYKSPTDKIPIHIKWYPPPQTYKLNLNASFLGNHKPGGIGSIIRNTQGDMIVGFANKIKAYNPTHAELLALHTWQKLAYEKKLASLEIDTDSTDIIQLLEHNSFPAYTNIIFECRYLLKKLGNPVVRHSFRKGNKVAHVLSKLGCKQQPTSTTTILNSPPDAVKRVIQKDKNATSTTRLLSSSICNKLAMFENLSIIPTISNSDVMSL